MTFVSQNNGRTLRIGQQQYLNLTGTSYLNLPYLEAFQQLIVEGMQTYGASYGSSPLSEPQFAVFNELARFLAEFYGTEAALLCQTGFVASQLAVAIVEQEGFELVQHSNFHPAIERQNVKPSSQKAIAATIVDPISISFLCLNEVENFEAKIIDASHGFGICDELLREFAKEPNTLICGSLNKALGINGGMILGSQKKINAIKDLPAYSTSSVASPAFCYALLQAFKTGIIQSQKEKLNQLLTLIPQSENYDFQVPLPVLNLADEREVVFQEFYKRKMMIWRNEYPKNSGKLLNRVVIHAGLQENDVQQVLTIIQ